MKLLLELGADRHQNNLPTIDKIAPIIPKKNNHAGFHVLFWLIAIFKMTIINIILLAQIQLLTCLFTVFNFFPVVI